MWLNLGFGILPSLLLATLLGGFRPSLHTRQLWWGVLVGASITWPLIALLDQGLIFLQEISHPYGRGLWTSLFIALLEETGKLLGLIGLMAVWGSRPNSPFSRVAGVLGIALGFDGVESILYGLEASGDVVWIRVLTSWVRHPFYQLLMSYVWVTQSPQRLWPPRRTLFWMLVLPTLAHTLWNFCNLTMNYLPTDASLVFTLLYVGLLGLSVGYLSIALILLFELKRQFKCSEQRP
jgi:RsiW-degrading membrane proteinase PrsW (M82 family)